MKIVFLLFLLIYNCFLNNSKDKIDDTIIDESAISLKKQILKNYSVKEKKSIAIASFARTDLIKPGAKYHSVIPKLGILYANSLQNEMFQPEKFDLLERQRIDGLLSEVYYEKIGLTEENNKNLKLSGADYILLGTLQKRESSIRIDARLVGILDGKIVSVGTTTLPITGYVLDLYTDFPEVYDTFQGNIISNDSWQVINGFIEGRSEIIIEAQGQWSMTSDNIVRMDAGGVEVNPSGWGDYRIYKDFNHGALLCRLNTMRDLVMTVGIWKIDNKGIIECRINDNDLENNVGSQIVTIKVKRIY